MHGERAACPGYGVSSPKIETPASTSRSAKAGSISGKFFVIIGPGGIVSTSRSRPGRYRPWRYRRHEQIRRTVFLPRASTNRPRPKNRATGNARHRRPVRNHMQRRIHMRADMHSPRHAIIVISIFARLWPSASIPGEDRPDKPACRR